MPGPEALQGTKAEFVPQPSCKSLPAGSWQLPPYAPQALTLSTPTYRFALHVFHQGLEGLLADLLAGQYRPEGHLDQAPLWGQVWRAEPFSAPHYPHRSWIPQRSC